MLVNIEINHKNKTNAEIIEDTYEEYHGESYGNEPENYEGRRLA